MEREVAYMEAWGDDQANIHKQKIDNYDSEAAKLKEINGFYKKQQDEFDRINTESAKKEGMLVYQYIEFMTGKKAWRETFTADPALKPTPEFKSDE